MHPIEALGDEARLVALQGPDQVPHYGLPRERIHFLEGFLHVVFAECVLACRQGFFDQRRGMGLGNCQKRHAAGSRPAAAAACAMRP